MEANFACHPSLRFLLFWHQRSERGATPTPPMGLHRTGAVGRYPRPTEGPCLSVGEGLAASGALADPLRLGPVYPRPAEAVTLWEARHGGGNRPPGGTG